MFLGLDESLLWVFEGDGDIYHQDILAVLVGHDVWVQLAFAAWDNAVDGYAPC